LQNSEHTLFFALVGPNNDAHAYIEDLIDGVQNFVVLRIPDAQIIIFIVENTLAALQHFAAYYRSLSFFP
jgi:alanine racemase